MTDSPRGVMPLEQPAGPAPPLKTRPARPARPPRRPLPRRLWIVVGAVAVGAFALWFFVLRDIGDPFAGTWTATQAPVARVVISGPGRHIKVTFSGRDPSGALQTFTVAGHKDGRDLVVTVDDFAKATGDPAEAAQVRNTFAAYVKDFRLVFARRDPGHLTMTLEGRFVGIINVSLDERTIVLTKVD